MSAYYILGIVLSCLGYTNKCRASGQLPYELGPVLVFCAAVTHYRKLSGLKQHKFYFPVASQVRSLVVSQHWSEDGGAAFLSVSSG